LTHSRPWHSVPLAEIVREGQTDLDQGLALRDAAARLERFGPNIVESAPGRPFLRLVSAQFGDTMVLMLLAATAFSWLVGERLDAYAILAIVLLNASLGALQEFRAGRAIAALRRLAAPSARVLRDGRDTFIEAAAVVPGDILLLDAGDRVAADARVFRAHQMECDEALLTGESAPVGKRPAELPAGCPLGDRLNMVRLGTLVTRGRGRAVVVATGPYTEIGAVAGLIGESDSGKTPLMRRFAQLSKVLVAVAVTVCAGVVALGIARGERALDMVLAGISLAVAAVPEGLPAIVTVALSLGVRRMASRNVITRRLPAVETLGSATVICADKTGTLTRGLMSVREVDAGDRVYTLESEPGGQDGTPFLEDGRPVSVLDHPALWRTLLVAALCNNATGSPDAAGSPDAVGAPGGAGAGARGDPTEAALARAARGGGLPRERLARTHPRIGELPFESTRRSMSTVHRLEDGALLLAVKGAPDVIAACSVRILDDTGGERPMLAHDRSVLSRRAEAMAQRALRVLAMAYRIVPENLHATVGSDEWTPAVAERDLTFAGLAGIMDPPRPEVPRAVRTCLAAGIIPVMITGDHPATAAAVGREIGLLAGPENLLLTGNDLDQIDDRELVRLVRRTRVYARVSPGHKLRIVRALKAAGHVVAMTGDGVNDAPAVREADIGVAMGRGGTDVTREASAMVLTDDNFASIVAAVAEGRAIYDSIRRFIRYLLGCNLGEIIAVTGAMAAGMPLPLTPIQILWMNLVTDGLPAMALGLEAPDPDLVRRPPRPPGEGVFAGGLGLKILGRGLLVGLPSLAAYAWARGYLPADLPFARTVAFATLVVAQLIYAFDCRSEVRGPLALGVLSNPWLVGACLLSLGMLLAVVYVPSLCGIFETVPLDLTGWLVVLACSALGSVLAGMRRAFTGPDEEKIVRTGRGRGGR
jgi:Ca2+-transporting ATPase